MVMSNLTTIHERTGSLSGRRESTPDNPVVPGVKVLGVDSKNGRKYPVEVMKKALEKYEGAIVNIDHPAGSEPRSYEDRFGRLTNTRMEADGIYADLAYNPKHPLAQGFEWWVKNDPKAIGLSHNAQAKTKLNAEGVEEIEEIVTVESVDLVAEPATTAGLLEAVMRKKVIVKEQAKKVEEMKIVKKVFTDFVQWARFVTTQLGAPPQITATAETREFKNEFKNGKGEVQYYKENVASNKSNVSEAPMTPKQKSIQAKKDLVKQAWAKQGVVTMRAIDKDEYPPIPGMEGPFQYRNGQILYYDPKEGKYYDRKTDMYQSRAPESVSKKTEQTKRRKSIKRILVAEAIKDILKVRKGV